MWKCENVEMLPIWKCCQLPMPMLPIGNWKLGLATLATLATFAAVFAEVPADTQLTLGEVDLPVYIHMSSGAAGYLQPPVAYPISTVRAPTSPEAKVTAV